MCLIVGKLFLPWGRPYVKPTNYANSLGTQVPVIKLYPTLTYFLKQILPPLKFLIALKRTNVEIDNYTVLLLLFTYLRGIRHYPTIYLLL